MGNARKPVSTTLSRQWRMVMRLRQRKWTVLVLARNFGVTKSTVERDLATMVEAGLPVRALHLFAGGGGVCDDNY